MFNFTSVPDITQMPREELCHVCHVRRLAMMQASQYSVYDEFYKSMLEYVYAECGGSGPTDMPPPLPSTTPPDPAPDCVTGKRYTTVSGDTCESIANSTGVYSAALYMGNQDLIPDCSAVPAGVSVCIPIPCKTYYLKPSDTCVSIELAFGLEYGQIRSYNPPWIDAACSNLHSSTDFYGKLICVSPQGGEFRGTVPPGLAPTPGPGSDGYTRDAVPPPTGAEVAEGTTRSCGKWHVVVAQDTCSTICIQAGIPSDLFRQVNPSVATGDCTSALKLQTAVCVGPTYRWNATAPATTTIISASLLEAREG